MVVDVIANANSSYLIVRHMVWLRDTMYAVGNFDEIGGSPCNQLARWDGNQWCAMVDPDYFHGVVTCLGTFRDTLYIGGNYIAVSQDSVPIARIAKWVGGSYTDTCGVWTSIEEPQGTDTPGFSLYPNPGHSNFTVTLDKPEGALLMYNAQGQLLHSTIPTSTQLQIECNAWSKGLYIIVWQPTNGVVISKRWVKE